LPCIVGRENVFQQPASVYDLLNEEILALIVQAQLLPPSPEVRGDIVEFVVPVAFSLQR